MNSATRRHDEPDVGKTLPAFAAVVAQVRLAGEGRTGGIRAERAIVDDIGLPDFGVTTR
jgi:hypothetical protein